MTAARILSALHKVKGAGPDRWVACCPAHEDKSPSLAIRELDDGRVLLHCFAGCGADEVLGAIGLSMTDLFPPRPAAPGGGTARERRLLMPGDVFDIARHEVGVVAIVAADMLRSHAVSEDDFQRLAQAHSRLDRIAEVAYGR